MSRPSVYRRSPIGAACLSVALAAVAALSSPVAAQDESQPPQPDRRIRSLAFIADSIAAAGDTATAVRMLDSAVRVNKKDGPSWHQLGVLLWNQARSQRSGGFIRDQRAVRLLAGADSSLRLATQFSPDSARFWMSLSDFNATSGLSTTQFASGGNATKALDAAEKTGDVQQASLAANAAGMAAWRRYEPIAKRGIASDNRPVDLTSLRRDQAADYLNSFVRRIEPPTGDRDYKNAVELFQRALEADPTNQKIARNYYMALGEREQWAEMLAVARTRASRYPLDYQAQLARGLAAHRLNEGAEAQIAFDSAMRLVDDTERDRMMSLSRILRPTMQAGDKKQRKDGIGDAVAFNRLPPEQRQAVGSLYWLMADPLAITQENEHRNEFLARVAWADFRWSIDEQNIRGSDTDRGDIYIRYGPPDKEMSIPGNSSGTQGAGVTLAWTYPNNLVFFFDLMPGFMVARTAFFDKDFVEQVRNAVPVAWNNVPATKTLDTIPVMITRFRARGDSMDVLVAATIPADSMVRGLEMDRTPIDVDLRIFDQFANVRGVESTQLGMSPDSARPLARTWERRVGPGLNLLRVEALQADSRRAARSVTQIQAGLGTTDFGMSDILLGSSPAPRGDAAPSSWRDIETTPSSGTFSTSRIGLVWEIYELANREGQARYRIDVEVERVTKGVGRFTARIVDNLGRTVGRETRGMNKLTMSFNRNTPPNARQVEYLTLNLADASAGEYRLNITIVDQNSNRRTSRSTAFNIR